MKVLMNKTEVYLCNTREEADEIISEFRENEGEYNLIGSSISVKATKEAEYFQTTVKSQFMTLAEAKSNLE